MIVEENEHLGVTGIAFCVTGLPLLDKSVLGIADSIVGLSELLFGLCQLFLRNDVATVLKHLVDILAHAVHHSDLVEVHCYLIRNIIIKVPNV